MMLEVAASSAREAGMEMDSLTGEAARTVYRE